MIVSNHYGAIQYEKVLGVIPLPKNKFFRYSLRKHLQKLYVKGTILTEKNEIVIVETNDNYAPKYTLHVSETDASGKVISQMELLCGTKSVDVTKCYKLLACHGSLTYEQMASILKLHGYPKLNDVIKNYKVCISRYCRYHNIISRNNFMLDFIELVEVKEL
ncbi:MAG: hypothetical protein ACYDG2_18370 [Ruminiclostridium sp.]